MEPNKLKDIILNVKHPCVVKSGTLLPWPCLQQSFSEWCAAFDSSRTKLIPFEGCSTKNGINPQWERRRTQTRMRMKDILKPNHEGRWNSFSYRNISELPAECRKDIRFAWCGFPEVDEDITFWIGSAFAHTPCHYDTYGCNIVVQVYGRKSWILLPPEAKLTPVRVPFEESSVYCAQNFYSPPSYRDFVGVENEVYHVILEPGMTLIVPPRWWHFVECLEPSLNFNTWLPLSNDLETLISECITKIMILETCKDLPAEIRAHVLNPNEDPVITDDALEQTYHILEYLQNKKQNKKRQVSDITRYNSGYLTSDALNALLEECGEFVNPVAKLECYDFFKLMKQNSLRFNNEANDRIADAVLQKCQIEQLEDVRRQINCCCSPSIVQLVKDAM
ncbi:HSPB1-associated protein 1 homolog [Anopheles aquasalis]|uniref:HSPB1-associated protein 1 homolog n=1 Tax=Anopheles aquasalis TaxID=42839 RepID=UPI00215B126F|nr:HSPB1-associated protein 1 homolog [Anopheles aquasalis]